MIARVLITWEAHAGTSRDIGSSLDALEQITANA
jgi:hypothetical protein